VNPLIIHFVQAFCMAVTCANMQNNFSYFLKMHREGKEGAMTRFIARFTSASDQQLTDVILSRTRELRQLSLE